MFPLQLLQSAWKGACSAGCSTMILLHLRDFILDFAAFRINGMAFWKILYSALNRLWFWVSALCVTGK